MPKKCNFICLPLYLDEVADKIEIKISAPEYSNEVANLKRNKVLTK